MYFLLGILVAVTIAILLAFCLAFPGRRPSVSYSNLRAAIHAFANKYGGTVHDRGNIDGLDVEFEIDCLQMFAGTFVSHRRKYINYHAFEIRILPSNGSIPQRQVLSLAEEQSADVLLSTISAVAAGSRQ